MTSDRAANDGGLHSRSAATQGGFPFVLGADALDRLTSDTDIAALEAVARSVAEVPDACLCWLRRLQGDDEAGYYDGIVLRRERERAGWAR